MAGVRVAAAVFFLLFGEYKVAGPGFAHGGFQTFLHDSIANSAVIFYRPILSGLVLPHPVVFGYLVGVVELRIGIALLVGLWVRLACVLGILFLLNLTLAAWREPGHGARGGALFWRSAGSFAVAVAAHQSSFSLLRSLPVSYTHLIEWLAEGTCGFEKPGFRGAEKFLPCPPEQRYMIRSSLRRTMGCCISSRSFFTMFSP